MESSSQTQPRGKSALGITGFVIGLVALCTSFLPIINNASALLAVLGLVFSVIGVVVCVRGTKGGKGLIRCSTLGHFSPKAPHHEKSPSTRGFAVCWRRCVRIEHTQDVLRASQRL